ncbi:MAG TPA: VWA domain-containing protein [Candidatus Polarisedimenticolaceae bacterium]|nr:VWA domain-containing protein [Candidatus Polarisedimenticolaceae bacterium]
MAATIAPADDEPQRTGMTERTGRRLIQVDVSVTGPADKIAGLARDRFEVTIGGKTVVPVAVDEFCSSAQLAPPGGGPSATISSASSPGPPTSYLFYFDQRNLTVDGRRHAWEQAANLVRTLVRNGNRASIVASGSRLATLQDFTDRPELLLAALERLVADPRHWDDYATLEFKRERDIADLIKHRQPEAACGLALTYMREEAVRSRQALDLLGATLTRFSRLDEPKIALYFADTLRDEPGRHYVLPVGRDCVLGAGDMMLSFGKLHADAAAYGVKLYAVQGEGIGEAYPSGSPREIARHDAEGGLKALALDTGGDAFFSGASAANVAKKIVADAACVYLLSFDPKDLPEDRSVPIDVRVLARGVHVRTQTSVVVQSESARRTSMLLALFLNETGGADTIAMRGGVVPLAVVEGRLRVLVQTSLPETQGPHREAWDVGLSVVSGGQVSREASGRVTVDRPGVRIVLESETEIEPGEYEVATAAVEDLSGRLGNGRLAGTWSGKIGPSGIAGIAVLQPGTGAFLRDGAVRENGSMVVADGEPVHSDRPVAFVSLICRTAKKQKTARVHRVLGGATITLPDDDVAFEGAACVQVRDVVPPGTLAPGTASYAVRVEGAPEGATRAVVVE